MKRSTLALASLATLAVTTTFATPALAQSSVTLFGVLDLAARSVKNNDTQYRLESGGASTGRLGVRGVEDLGGGLKAGFHLEGQINADDGNASGFNWTRRSTVSLMGGFGEVRLGRDKQPNGLIWDEFDPFRDTGIGASTRLFNTGDYGISAFSRASNSVGYFAPKGPITFQAMVALGEGTSGAKYQGFRTGYAGGGLVVQVAYGVIDVTGGDFTQTSLAATYDMKSAKLWGFYTKSDGANRGQDNWLLGVSAPIGATELKASYQSMSGNESFSNRDATKITVGGTYALSKRTTLYTHAATISNTNTRYTVATGTALNVGTSSRGYEFGVRHSF